jgi:hypothetical protein
VLRELGLEKVTYEEAVNALLAHSLAYCVLTLLFVYFLHKQKYTRTYYNSPSIGGA